MKGEEKVTREAERQKKTARRKQAHKPNLINTDWRKDGGRKEGGRVL